MVIGGAGEGRLYIFSFTSGPSLSLRLPSQQSGGESSPCPALVAHDGIDDRVQCSMYVVCAGCRASEVRCCSFLPAKGSSLVAVALRASRSRSGSVLVLDLSRAAVAASTGCHGISVVQGLSAVADTAALQVVEGNCGCCRSREIHDLTWSPWSRYLVASVENALLINLDKQHVKQLPLRSLQNPRGGRASNKSTSDEGDRCCWGCTALGPFVFYCFSGGWYAVYGSINPWMCRTLAGGVSSRARMLYLSHSSSSGIATPPGDNGAQSGAFGKA